MPYNFNVTRPGLYAITATVQNGSCTSAITTATFEADSSVGPCTITATNYEVCPHGNSSVSFANTWTPWMRANAIVEWHRCINCTSAPCPVIPGATGTTQNTNEIGPIGSAWTSVCWYAVVRTRLGYCPPCTSNTVTVNVTQPPAPFSISPAGPLYFCQGSSPAFALSTGIPGGFDWYQNGVNISPIPVPPSPTMLASAAGEYFAVASNQCASTQSTNTVSVVECDLALEIAGNCCSDGITPIPLSANCSSNCPGTFTYSWSTGETGQNIILPAPSASTTVCVTITLQVPGGLTCTKQACLNINACF